MRAIRVLKKGDCRSEPDVLVLSDDVEPPTLVPTGNELLVRVLTCSVNAGDVKLMTGALSLPGKTATLPYTPGLEVCGVVEAVGAKVNTFQIGDRIIAAVRPHAVGGGGMAEHVVVESGLAAKVPSTLSPLSAVSLPLAGVMALQAIKDVNIQKDSKVIVLGASSAVGSMIVQLAKHAGAVFIAGTTTEERLTSTLPLDLVIVDDNKHDKWWDVLQGKELDVVIDCLGEANAWRHADKTLKSSGAYATLLGDLLSDGDVKATTQMISMGLVNMWKAFWRASPKFKMVSAFPSTALLGEVIERVVDGTITPLIDSNSPLGFKTEALQQAVVLQRGQQVSGKLVMQISEA
ncbi:hypothetical protein Poli38472_007198 [Pythium oligandrum]|uniref:Enoyl reductase (ER) domain-containing protein n=1 Tax=Pythium oligandrum TaxID=41045 RepID=A0A8K1FHS4_PYTOL|nr:hypothetical protein Poli38472_007198 [Pythium oligandrum]|eukprot:TMW59053.1 hypothetical protein Poli38472_007198 [Pythium oligandrum]